MSITVIPSAPAPTTDMTGGGVSPDPSPDSKQTTPSEASVPKAQTSPQLAQLARREQALRQQARQIAAERQSFQTKQAEIEQRVSSQWREKLVSNPWNAMLEAGLTPEQATDVILNQPKPEQVQVLQMQKEIQALKIAQEQSQGLFEKQEQDQRQQAKNHMAMEANMLIKSDQTYEPIKAMGAQAAIPTLIEEVFEKGLPGKYPRGYIMSVEDAAQMVNDYCLDEATKLAKLASVQRRLTPQASSPAQKPFSEKPHVTNTLSNRMSVSMPKNLTNSERRQRAIAAFMGKI
jgi:hypothetical protein